MSKPKQIWPGPAMQRFFEAVLADATRLDADARSRLAAALAKPIGRLLVYRDPSDGAAQPIASTPVAAPVAEDDAAPVAVTAPAPAEALPPFDPFAFSVVAVFKREGRAGLVARLAEVTRADDLRRIAESQHLALDATATTAEQLREAIADGAARRLAERRAAAS